MLQVEMTFHDHGTDDGYRRLCVWRAIIANNISSMPSFVELCWKI